MDAFGTAGANEATTPSCSITLESSAPEPVRRANDISAPRWRSIAASRSIAPASRGLALQRQRDAIGDAEHRNVDALVGDRALVHLARGDRAGVLVGAVQYLPAPQDVVEHDQPAG